MKNIRRNISKAVFSGIRSSSGKIVFAHFDLLKELSSINKCQVIMFSLTQPSSKVTYDRGLISARLTEPARLDGIMR